MKKSLLALAVLGAFAGAASAQSTVTLYGRVDLAVGKIFGNENKGMANGSGSRLGVRGVEDLGGGLQVGFNIEHRFNADNGAFSDTNRMWGGRSIVGMRGGFGEFWLGREYTTAFLQSQLPADPWGFDTNVSQVAGAFYGGGIARIRNDSSFTYRLNLGGFQLGAQVAEATDQLINVPDKPWNAAVSYNAGPISAGFAYELTGAATPTGGDVDWTTVNFAWNFGFVKPGFFYGTGTDATGFDVDTWAVTATAPIGAGELRLLYGERERGGVKDVKGFLVGYHYALSKRTTIYADYGRNDKQTITATQVLTVPGSGLTGEKDAYDIGIKHNF